MRIGQMISGVAGFALMVGVGQRLLAQTTATVPAGGVAASSGGAGFFMGRGVMPGIPGSPYTGTRKTTRVQKLANGTTITHVSTMKEARDSSGRTYRESKPESAMGSENAAANYVVVNVHDPVSRTNTFWNSNTKEATVMHLPETHEVKYVDVRPVKQTAQPTPMPRLESIKPQFEDLGTQTINGVEARGERMTTVIPTGREGNDQPITVTNEQWTADGSNLVVMSIHDDPRTGTTTMELTDLEKGEPDPALFQVPEGYTVKDQTPVPRN